MVGRVELFWGLGNNFELVEVDLLTSRAVRSEDWVKMRYENHKPDARLVKVKK